MILLLSPEYHSNRKKTQTPDFVFFQAVNRQISLEQQLQTLKENEQALQSLQESLSQLDHTLTSYLTDRIDAFQLPQEAQVQGTCAARTHPHTHTPREVTRQDVTPEQAPERDGSPRPSEVSSLLPVAVLK